MRLQTDDYAHARHAGNAGDVLKHVALLALLEAMAEGPSPLIYLETHAGDGLYPLGSAGEWGDGALRVWNAREGLVGRYAEVLRRQSAAGAQRPQALPGSPLVARAALRAQDRMVLHETDPRAAAVLRRALPDAEVRQSDGLAALPGAVQGRSLVLIDPPFTRKQEWTDAARALERIPGVPAALWYPVKALTRPRALLQELAKLGVHGTAIELHWTPLRLERDRLNGAGMILVDVPPAAVAAICAVLPELGAALQTHGEWGAVQIGF
ncbi:MAG TPA: 23S rRNA (adenine(2030)-N(6))-methyltransferase RlmJ [Myxococcales bacterium]|nr:23S rRNA (adenine(2030)-N(6))-methyltransferase RlmJ [Myxococcales bacterium]